MGKMTARVDNKTMTVRDLMQTLHGELVKHRAKGPEAVAKYLDGAVTVSSDEEGNNFSGLYGVEIAKKGITLWPA